MEIYFAPMQGVTGWPFRMTHLRHYDGVDRYYMPFISVHQSRAMKGGEKRDMDPAHNVPGRMVPQLLPGRAVDSLAYMEMLADAGYDEVSLNFGCPARTVTTKHKGAGILAEPSVLDAYLEHLFTGMTDRLSNMKVTVKTRVGMDDRGRIDELIRIYNRYPVAQVQVHARLGKDAYDGTPDLDAFRRFYEGITHPLCYNGDIRSSEDLRNLQEAFPELKAVMIGRGMIADPMLAEKLKAQPQGGGTPDEARMPESGNQVKAHPQGGGAPEHTENVSGTCGEKERLIRFHDDLCDAWYADYGNEYPTICRMMEIWDYLERSFPGSARLVRKIRKARKLDVYMDLARQILAMDYCPST